MISHNNRFSFKYFEADKNLQRFFFWLFTETNLFNFLCFYLCFYLPFRLRFQLNGFFWVFLCCDNLFFKDTQKIAFWRISIWTMKRAMKAKALKSEKGESYRGLKRNFNFNSNLKLFFWLAAHHVNQTC